MDLIITGLHNETDRIRVFDLSTADGSPLPDYEAGAHLTFDLGDKGTRSYSLIDWAQDAAGAAYRIAVQREDGGTGGSRAMHALTVGTKIAATPPKNDFGVEDHTGPAVLLGGGIGITPLISMATTLQRTGRPFALHYAGRSRDVMGFLEPLSQDFSDQLTCHPDDETPLDLTALMATLTLDTHLYICGPKGMIDAARNAASAASLPDAQVHLELFSTPQAEDGDTAFEVEVASTGEVYVIPPGKSIIDVLEENGLDLMYDCQRGDCGICQTDVVSGTPDHRDVVLSDAEKASGDVMQICVSRAKSARLVLDL
ncbi:PDR/VanB family oxidoreductase [Sulfitobacter noctilucicola]|nr:PDR/VanB family oxidoreductase [Sulfitobacter noctilucicola]